MNLYDLNPVDATAITPSNSVNLPVSCVAIYVGGAGNIALITKKEMDKFAKDSAYVPVPITFTGLLAGTILNICCSRVLVTGTTATSLIALLAT